MVRFRGKEEYQNPFYLYIFPCDGVLWTHMSIDLCATIINKKNTTLIRFQVCIYFPCIYLCRCVCVCVCGCQLVQTQFFPLFSNLKQQNEHIQ